MNTSLLPFRQKIVVPQLPAGYVLDENNRPSAEALNHLLKECHETVHPSEIWKMAFANTVWHLSVIDENSGMLSGFVRATSDRALNINLWNLAALPGEHQEELLSVLINRALVTLRRDMPGCSFSVSAAPMAITSLKSQGFLVDPGGIRAMGLRLN